jgi:RNA polymerase sigma-70 factor (sigma-E family)
MVVYQGREAAMNDQAEAEFAGFARARWPALVRLGYGLTGDLGVAEDLAQTALAKAYASWPRVRAAGNPDAYIRRIVVNANRSRFRKPRVPESLAGTGPGGAAVDPIGQVVENVAVMTAVGRLPRGQRAVVLLRYWLDMTETEVAAVLGCSVGNVRSQASRALAKLRASAELTDR